jgi:hypothetical protein
MLMSKAGKTDTIIILALISIALILILLVLGKENDKLVITYRAYASDGTNTNNGTNYFKDILLPFIAIIIAGLAIIWNVVDYLKRRSGYLRLHLECKYESNEGRKYIVSKASLDNTSTRPIYVVHTFLMIVNRSISFEQEINKKGKDVIINKSIWEMEKRLSEYNKNTDNRLVNFVDYHKMQNWQLLNGIFEYIGKEKDLKDGCTECVIEDNTVIKFLPYFSIHTRLGSLAHMATTHIQEMKNMGIYSVYFVVIGEEWYKKAKLTTKDKLLKIVRLDTDSNSYSTYARSIHEEIIVK